MEAKLLLLGALVSVNNLALCLALGTLDIKKYHLRIVVFFGSFEFLFPLLGLYLGNFFVEYIKDLALIIGSSILFLLGISIIVGAFLSDENKNLLKRKATGYFSLLVLSVLVSIDNLMVGFSMGLNEVNPLFFASIIGVFSVIFSFAGLNLGKYLGHRFGFYIEIVSGILLIGLAGINFLGFL